MIIGICGKSGCGKTTLANNIIELASREAVHLDIDKVGHQVITIPEVKEELVNTFGESILTEDYVDRKKLNKIVFDSKEEMAKLTEITWKHMQIIINKFISENKDKIIILDWQLLPITQYFNMCDIKILLDVPYEVRKERTMKRDNITEEAFDLREKASTPINPNDFDYVLKDNGREQVERVVKSL